MDKLRKIKADLYREIDIFNTECRIFEKSIDLLQQTAIMMSDEQKLRINEQVEKAKQIAKDAGEIEQAILEVVNSGGTKEAIEKAERLRDRLNGR